MIVDDMRHTNTLRALVRSKVKPTKSFSYMTPKT